MHESPSVQVDWLESLVGELAGEFTDRLNQGEQPRIEEYTQRYPEVADVIRQVLGSLAAVASHSRRIGAKESLGQRFETERAAPIRAAGRFSHSPRDRSRWDGRRLRGGAVVAGAERGPQGTSVCSDAQRTTAEAIQERGSSRSHARTSQYRSRSRRWLRAGRALLRHVADRRAKHGRRDWGSAAVVETRWKQRARSIWSGTSDSDDLSSCGVNRLTGGPRVLPTTERCMHDDAQRLSPQRQPL